MPGPTRDGRQLDLDMVVDIAVGIFLQRGYDGATMLQIAQEAGVRKPSLYHHVSGKEELLQLGVRRALDAFEAMFEEPAAAATAEPGARLRYVLRRTCVIVAEHVPETALVIRARGNTPTELDVLASRRRFNRILSTMIADARVGGAGTDVDPDLAARLVLGMITSTVDWWRPGGAIDAAALADTVEALLFDRVLG